MREEIVPTPRPVDVVSQRGYESRGAAVKIDSTAGATFDSRTSENGRSHHAQRVRSGRGGDRRRDMQVEQFRGRTD